MQYEAPAWTSDERGTRDSDLTCRPRRRRSAAAQRRAVRPPARRRERRDASRDDARDALVELHLPLAEHLARRFGNRGEPHDDLVQVATIGLIKAVDRFEVERGLEFSTYATPTIVGEIKRHFRDKTWAVRVPRRLQELRLAMTRATADLSQSLGRSPTVAELAERSAAARRVIEGLEAGDAYSTLSLDAGRRRRQRGELLDTLGIEDDAFEAVENLESLKPLLARLARPRAPILMLRFFENRRSPRSPPSSASRRCTCRACWPARWSSCATSLRAAGLTDAV